MGYESFNDNIAVLIILQPNLFILFIDFFLKKKKIKLYNSFWSVFF